MRTAAQIKGWCPGAWKPMMSGDGLVVRVRPRQGRLTVAQALGLCDLARRHGSGVIDVTRRANLQLRGVSEDGHPQLMEGLALLDLLDETEQMERRRNILVTPFWTSGDLTDRLSRNLEKRLGEFPDLPAKFGFAIDLGARPVLGDVAADIRLERALDGSVIVRADGADSGRSVNETNALDHVLELSLWFAAAAGSQARRMRQLLGSVPLPAGWRETAPAPSAPPAAPGLSAQGAMVGLAFGQADAADLSTTLTATAATGLTVTPWRMLRFDGARTLPGAPYLTEADDPLLQVDACPGAPACASASVPTRTLARALAGRTGGTLHLSGCAKGCARGAAADLTLVGRNGGFDLVVAGSAWDDPGQRGLSPDDILKLIG